MAYTAAVITVSDLGSRGQRVDTSGPAICAMLEKAGFTVTYTAIVPDEIPQIQTELTTAADGRHINLIITTGGTGLSPRDCHARSHLGRPGPRNSGHSGGHVGGGP